MHIKEIKLQHRRDFTAVYECEHCGHLQEGRGYDDANFHENVIPGMVCPNCSRTADTDYAPNAPKYPEGMEI